jgi:hypothetical protein
MKICELHSKRCKPPTCFGHICDHLQGVVLLRIYSFYYIYIIHIYRVSQNLYHKLFLGIPYPHLSKKVPINMGPKVTRFRDIDLRSYAGIEYYIRCSKCWPFAATHPLRRKVCDIGFETLCRGVARYFVRFVLRSLNCRNLHLL